MAADSEPAHPRRWRALGVTLAAGFMSLLDVSIVNVALPSIQRGLDASLASVQWVVSGYALTFGLALVAGGRLGDILGRRRMFVIALSGFVATSAFAGLAPDAVSLVVARLLQGFAGGLLTPQNTGLIQDLFHGAERGRAFGVFGATVGLSTAIGPVLGGLILAGFGEETGWRWVFLVNVPVGALALLLAVRWLPTSARRAHKLRSEIDFFGALLLGSAVLCVLFPVLRAESGAVGGLWALFGLAVLLGVLFVRWEQRVTRLGRPPLLNTTLFTATRGYAAGTAIGAVYFCGFSGVFLVLAMFFQNGLGYSPLQSGLAVTPFAIGFAMAAPVAGRLVSRWGRLVTLAGLTLVVLGLSGVAAVLQFVPAADAGLASALPLVVGGIGGGAVISPNTTLTLESVPSELAGVAGGVLQTGQRVGTAIGTTLLATVFQAVTSGSGQFGTGAAVAMLTATGFVLLAMVLAVAEYRRRRGHPAAPATAESAEVARSADTGHC